MKTFKQLYESKLKWKKVWSGAVTGLANPKKVYDHESTDGNWRIYPTGIAPNPTTQSAKDKKTYWAVVDLTTGKEFSRSFKNISDAKKAIDGNF